MKTNVSDSSINTYHSEITLGKGAKQCRAILEYMKGKGAMTRREIATALDMETGTVAGRVNSLVESGALVESENLFRCSISGRRVHTVWVNGEG